MPHDELEHVINPIGQPVGRPLPGWTPPPRPERRTLVGRTCRVEPLDLDRHAADLYAANSADPSGSLWTYLPYGPFTSLTSYADWLRSVCGGDDPLFFAIVENAGQKAVGLAAYLRIAPDNGAIEVGHINFSPLLQRTPAGTEAMHLMMRYAFALGYRRYEWKCDALNRKSRASAQRYGFSFEGLFRQATVYKERNRDTAWFAVIDREWPAIDAAFCRWLDPANFDADGRQKLRLSELTAPLLHRRDPGVG